MNSASVTTTTINKVQCFANILQIIETYRKNTGKLPSGRNIGPQHIGVVNRLVELMAIHNHKYKNLSLETNRGNMAAAFFCSPRSVYNYLIDLQQLDILHWTHEQSLINPDDFKIYVEFSNVVYAPLPSAAGEHNSDSTYIGKICHNHLNKKNNTDNNLSSGGQLQLNVDSAQKIEAKPATQTVVLEKKAEQGEQKPANLSKQEPIQLDANFSEEFRAAATADRAEIEHYSALLWNQSQQNLYNGKEYNRNVQTETMELIATALLYQAKTYQARRSECIKEIISNPAYQAETREKYRAKWLERDLKRKSLIIQQPIRAAWLLLSRAIEIQRENCKKKGYSCYKPTFYFSECFPKAVHYAHVEQKTMTTNKAANGLRVAHCTAKLRLSDIINRAAHTRKNFGYQTTLDMLRKEYTAFKHWLATTEIKDQQKYLDKFVSWMACINKL